MCDSILKVLEALKEHLDRNPVHWFVVVLPRWAGWLGVPALLAVLSRGLGTRAP